MVRHSKLRGAGVGAPDRLRAGLTALANSRVRLGIAGSAAITIRGSSYVTFDLNFSHARDRGNLSRLAQALSPFIRRRAERVEGIGRETVRPSSPSA